MKLNTLLIGGGVISRHYKSGLENSDCINLIALADVNGDCVARNDFSVPFYTDYVDALTLNPDVAILALPVTRKLEIATNLLMQGVGVIIEKPMCDNFDAIYKLYETAQKYASPLCCMFHWKFADEVLYLKNHISDFGNISKISAHICDDYADTIDGSIRQDRRGLDGAWDDSGINILSYFDELIDLSNAKLTYEEYKFDEISGQDKYVCKRFDANGIIAEITVDWQTASRKKTSQIFTDKGVLEIDHTAQLVNFNGKTVFSSPTYDRLTSHYYNLFKNFTYDYVTKERVLLLHKILFKGSAK